MWSVSPLAINIFVDCRAGQTVVWSVTWEDTSSWCICLIMIISWHPILYYVGSDITDTPAVQRYHFRFSLHLQSTVNCKSSIIELFVFFLLEGCPRSQCPDVPCLSHWLAHQLAQWEGAPLLSWPADLSLFGGSLRESRLSPTLKSRPGPTLTTRAASEQADTIL